MGHFKGWILLGRPDTVSYRSRPQWFVDPCQRSNFQNVSPIQIKIQNGSYLLVRGDTPADTSQPCEGVQSRLHEQTGYVHCLPLNRSAILSSKTWTYTQALNDWTFKPALLLSVWPTEMAKKVCPRLREITPTSKGGITQPRTHFFGHLCRFGTI